VEVQGLPRPAAERRRGRYGSVADRDEHRHAAIRIKKTKRATRGGRVMDVSPSKTGLYGFRDPSRPRLRNRRRHFYLRGSQDRRAKMERRTLRQKAGVAAGKLRLAPGLAEDGRVVLLRADPGEHAEVASFVALEGKTWNHPVVVGDRFTFGMLRRRPVTSCRWQKRKRLPPGCEPSRFVFVLTRKAVRADAS